MKRINPMTYLPDMEILKDSAIAEDVVSRMRAYDHDNYVAKDVCAALKKEYRTPEDFAALLSPSAMPFLEEMALKAKEETEKHFGSSVYLFTPLYISNYCDSACVYCGFNCYNKIRRAKLNPEGIEREMQTIAATGLEEILILTGESRKMSDVEYIGASCKIARRYFKMVGLEVYPLNTEDYAFLRECGADYVIVFQETYNPITYGTIHLEGHKRVFPYRLNAQERALRGGMRGVGFGALLGLGDFRKDAFATGVHAWLLQRKYPQAEISFSCPRLRPIVKGVRINPQDIQEAELLQIILAYRLFMPYSGITISTRECARFRDNVIGIAVTKISAGVSTSIGGHQEQEGVGDGQFEIVDSRSVDEVYKAIKERGLQPVMNDYVHV